MESGPTARRTLSAGLNPNRFLCQDLATGIRSVSALAQYFGYRKVGSSYITVSTSAIHIMWAQLHWTTPTQPLYWRGPISLYLVQRSHGSEPAGVQTLSSARGQRSILRDRCYVYSTEPPTRLSALEKFP